MASYSIEGFVTKNSVPKRAVVVVFSRETMQMLGQTQSSIEDGHYYIEFLDHPGPVFVICFRAAYGTPPEVAPYFSLTDPTAEAEIHDNITPVSTTPPPM